MMNDEMESSNSSAYDSIVRICFKYYVPQISELISQLRAILKDNPDVVYEKSDYVRSTLLHHAAVSRSPEFCQVLISLNEDLVRALDIFENLPFHAACRSANINTAKYLYRLYP